MYNTRKRQIEISDDDQVGVGAYLDPTADTKT